MNSPRSNLRQSCTLCPTPFTCFRHHYPLYLMHHSFPSSTGLVSSACKYTVILPVLHTFWNSLSPLAITPSFLLCFTAKHFKRVFNTLWSPLAHLQCSLGSAPTRLCLTIPLKEFLSKSETSMWWSSIITSQSACRICLQHLFFLSAFLQQKNLETWLVRHDFLLVLLWMQWPLSVHWASGHIPDLWILECSRAQSSGL